MTTAPLTLYSWWRSQASFRVLIALTRTIEDMLSHEPAHRTVLLRTCRSMHSVSHIHLQQVDAPDFVR
jgi:hypothetical protein